MRVATDLYRDVKTKLRCTSGMSAEFPIRVVNSGTSNGVMVALNRFLSKKKLFLVCRRHMYDIFLAAAYASIVGKPGKMKFALQLFQNYTTNRTI